MLTIQSMKPASISGKVIDRTGGTVAGLDVDLYQAALYPGTVYRTTTTGPDGSYSFPDVDAPQAYVVEVRSPTAGSLGSASVVVQPSKATILNLTIGIIPSTGNPAGTTEASTTGAPAPTGTTTAGGAGATTTNPTTALGAAVTATSSAATSTSTTSAGAP